MGMTDFYPEIEPHEHGMLEVGDGNLVYWEKRIDDLYDWGRLSEEEFQARLDSVLKARRTLEVKRSKRQRDIDEFETRRREIEQIRTAIAEDRFHAVWRPSANKLRVTCSEKPTWASRLTLLMMTRGGKTSLPPCPPRGSRNPLSGRSV